jgi:ABC-type dipeptide/oligopeptide/nickel transport system ATPase component
MRIRFVHKWTTISALLALTVMAVSLLAQQTTSLTIAGQSGSAKVVQVAGRNYVEVEGLARITNGSISFNSNQIILTMPGSSQDASAPPADSPPGFSKDFVTAGIEAMAQVREWHAALRNAIQRGYPLADDWLAAYRNQAQQSLRLASVAVSTPSDKNAYPFLANEFTNMQNLTSKYLQIAKNMDYMDPNSLDNDPLDQKIRTCAHSLASMATANQFIDDGSCQ